MNAGLINSTTDLVSLVPGLRPSGKYHIGACPFCGGDDRFTIKRTGEGDLWICRKCSDGKYHDAVAFLMRAEGKTFKEVTQEPRDEMRHTSSERRGHSNVRGTTQLVSRSANLVSPPDEEWQIARLTMQKRLADQLWIVDADRDADDGTARMIWRYLRHVRGLLPDTIRRYMLGFNATPFDTREGVHYPQGIYIPCMVDGQLWYVKVRLPVEPEAHGARRGGPPKYMALKGSRTALFNANELVGARAAVVVEGEFDAMLLGQFLPVGWAAVTMGGAGLRPDATFLPYFAGLERVLLCLDNDATGRAAQAAWREVLGWAEDAPPLPDWAKDFTEFWRKQGDVEEWIGRCTSA